MNCSIISYALIDRKNFISPAGTVNHPGINLFDIPRESVYDSPYRPFGRMGRSEKLIFSAAALALKSCSLPESAGIVLVTPKGSLDTDRAYMRSVREEFPSPALFAATLPSAPIAELAIPFTLRGPNRVFADTRGETGLLNALFLLNRGTSHMVCAFCDPDPVNGYASLLILASENSGAASLSFTPGGEKGETKSEFLHELIAHIHGKSDIQRELQLNSSTGRFTVKVNE